MAERAQLLVVDDEPNIRRILQVAFEKEGYVVTVAESGEQALRELGARRFSAMITDVTMPGMTGYELLGKARALHEDLPVVIVTAFGTIPQAIRAIRDGAFEYITKPFDLDALKRVVSAAMATPSQAAAPAKRGKEKTKSFIAESPAMRDVLTTIEQVADSRATVLITGESGVGKEVVARTLHDLSSRSKKPYVAISCAALPETLLESELFGYEKGAFTGAQASKVGRFELAHEGSLFLDEIGDIPMPIQVKLLRVLQEREFERLGASKPTRVDVRLITATNRDLKLAVDEGIFRLDLLYRLQVVEVHIPPLRERAEDIMPLAKHFLRKYCQENERPLLEIGGDAESALLRYGWPGNVRELENTMERAVVLSPKDERSLGAKLLPSAVLRAA